MVLLFLVNWWLSSKNLLAMQETWVQSLDWEDPLKEEMASHSRFLLGKFHGHRSLTGYSLWDHKELNTTELSLTYLRSLNAVLHSGCINLHSH